MLIFIIIIFTSAASAVSNIELNDTDIISENNDNTSIQDEIIEDDYKKENRTFDEEDKEDQKHETNISLNTYTNSSHIIMNADVKSDIEVNDGYVIYKLNKSFLKNNNKTIRVDVVNSKAVLAIPLFEYRGLYLNSEAIYSGSSFYKNSSIILNKKINTKLKPKIKIITNQSSYYPGEEVKLSIILSHREINNFTDGEISLKINGDLLKDKNNKKIIYNIDENSAYITITLPKGLKQNYVNITAVSGGSNYKEVTTSKKIKLKQLKTRIIVDNLDIDNNKYCIVNATVKDVDDDYVIGKTYMDFLIDGKNIKINNKSKVYSIYDGKINIKVPLNQYSKTSHKIQLKIRKNNAYEACNTKIYLINLTKNYGTKVIIDTPKKVKNATKNSIRIYVTYQNASILKTINQGKVLLTINNKLLTANVKYGKAVFTYKYPKKTGKYLIKVKYEGVKGLKDASNKKYITVTSGKITKNESKISGNKNPKTERITSINSIPNLVYMTNYVWADSEGTYTLTKNQLEEVFKQDSYTLYLNKHMSKYVAFRTINESNIYHVLKREKWNVIEKAVNKIRVKNSKGTIPKNITVNLKGKQYTYGETRAKQSTEYTCGPTATSVCTQTLRNYVNEHTLAVAFQTYKYRGTYASKIPKAMKNYNITATYIYKNNFNNVLDKLSKGGCAFVFYGVNHYVSILDVNKDKSKVLVSNSYGKYELGGGKIPNGWVSTSVMKKKFSKDSFAGLLLTLNYNLSKNTKTKVNNLYNNFGTNYTRKNTKEELNL